MYIVVVGARERDEDGDDQLVNELLTRLQKLYGSALVIISAATDKGVGKYVKDRCLAEKQKFKLIDVSTKIFGEMPKARLAQIFKARNATINELGNQFYVFDTKTGKGITEDLITRAINDQLPVYVYKPGQTAPVLVTPPAAAETPNTSSQDSSASQPVQTAESAADKDV